MIIHRIKYRCVEVYM